MLHRYWTVRSYERRSFKGAYTKGWNASGKPAVVEGDGLMANPFDSDDPRHDGWEDGYLDRAAGREFAHLLQEHDHDKECA